MPDCGTKPTIRACKVPDFETATLSELSLYEECLRARLDDANRRIQWINCMMGTEPAPGPPEPPTGGEAGLGVLPLLLGGASALGLILWKGMKKWRKKG